MGNDDFDGSGKDSGSGSEFVVGPDMREVDEQGVAALDEGMEVVGGDDFSHLVDPKRVNAFSSGGPPTWSIGTLPIGDDRYYVTYGNSEWIDPTRKGVSFELSIRVPANVAGAWPNLLLNELVRYMLTTGRELKMWEFMPFPRSITHAGGGFRDASLFPDTGMDAVCLVPDPLLPSIETPRGDLELRRALGIHPDERELMETWTVRGFAELVQQRNPRFTTDIARESLARDPEFVRAVEEGSRRDGSQFGFVAVPGVTFHATSSACTIELPGGDHARRIHRMVQARLPHGRELLVHDPDPTKRLAVALRAAEPSAGWEVTFPEEQVVEVKVPLDAPELAALAEPPDGGIIWEFDVKKP